MNLLLLKLGARRYREDGGDGDGEGDASDGSLASDASTPSMGTLGETTVTADAIAPDPTDSTGIGSFISGLPPAVLALIRGAGSAALGSIGVPFGPAIMGSAQSATTGDPSAAAAAILGMIGTATLGPFGGVAGNVVGNMIGNMPGVPASSVPSDTSGAGQWEGLPQSGTEQSTPVALVNALRRLQPQNWEGQGGLADLTTPKVDDTQGLLQALRAGGARAY